MSAISMGRTTGMTLLVVVMGAAIGRFARQSPEAGAALAPPLTTRTEAESAIREARSRFNAAIASHDTAALARDWEESVTVVSSRGAVSAGRAAYFSALAGQFAARPDIVYTRTPAIVTVHPEWGMATEEGAWTGHWTDGDGPVSVAGRYIAQWRLAGGRWLLHSEAFGLLTCLGGRYCREAP